MVNALAQALNWDSLVVTAITAIPVILWFSIVQRIVPEPYLDEVFHVRQAEHYVQGNWHIWDPKITTPPGLYVFSVLYLRILQVFPLAFTELGTGVLRSVNVFGSSLLVWVIHGILRLRRPHDESEEDFETRASSREPAHNVINICLFPPLFFFYGLYYTDVLSAFFVLLAYKSSLERRNDSMIVVAGLVSLLFRQTNIFWVSLFLGGLGFCRALQRGQKGVDFAEQPSFYNIIQESWQSSPVYDPDINHSCFEDYLKTSISYGITGLVDLTATLRALRPYLIILTSFAASVIWNAGVVLGDKENHIASLHLAQILYIWPYIAFFSLPLLLPHLLASTIPAATLPSVFGFSRVEPHPQHPRLLVALPILVVMTAVVHYNTLVHPFTLADNRHYTFYIFRLLLRHPLIKYLAVPIYYLCACAVVSALTAPPATSPSPSGKPKPKTPITSSEGKQTQRKVTPEPRIKQMPNENIGDDRRASFLLIYLLSTTASLITAPLFEPRYLIVPWLIWRLHLPTATTNASRRWGLWLETLWFLTINACVGYMFLYRGFSWPSEPGKVQRFMW